MALMLSKTYDALIAAGAPEAKARDAAEEIAAYDDRFVRIDIDLAALKADVQVVRAELQAVKTEVQGVKWMLGFVIAGVVSVIIGVLSLVRKAFV